MKYKVLIDGDQFLYRAAGHKIGYLTKIDNNSYTLDKKSDLINDSTSFMLTHTSNRSRFFHKEFKTRYFLPEDEMYKVIDTMIITTVRKVIKKLKITKEDLDVVIYIGSGNNTKHKLRIDPKYKSNRVYQKPPGLVVLKKYLVENYTGKKITLRDFIDITFQVRLCEDKEADEYVIDDATLKDIVVSSDKDVLYGAPGRKYDLYHDRFFIVDYKSAVKYTFALALSGDASDGITGLYRVGEPKYDPELKEFKDTGSWKLLGDLEKKGSMDEKQLEKSYYQMALEVLKYRLPGLHPAEREMMLVKNLQLIELIPILDKC